MKLHPLALWVVVWLVHEADAYFVPLPTIAKWRYYANNAQTPSAYPCRIDIAIDRSRMSMSSGSEYKGPTPDELQARAAAVRAELKELEAKAGLTRRPNAELIEQQQQTVPLPRTLLDSCWKVVLELRGVKSDKNRVPVRLTFSCRFSSDDNILQVEENHRFIKRGFVWEPERNPKDGRDYITFIAQVEGLSTVPDGRLYMNAYIDTIKGEDGENRYQFSEGAVTIKEVIKQSFWGIFNTSGLLAEFKVVGTWEAFPIQNLPVPPSPPSTSSPSSS